MIYLLICVLCLSDVCVVYVCCVDIDICVLTCVLICVLCYLMCVWYDMCVDECVVFV